jgi:hypothetical protein
VDRCLVVVTAELWVAVPADGARVYRGSAGAEPRRSRR